MARPRSFDPDRVLHAAERQFRTSGYNGTSVDDISAATGLGRGSLYAAFDGKHGVLLQAMAGYFARLAQGPRKVLAGPDEGALERLHAYLLRAVHGVPLAADVRPAPYRTAAACFCSRLEDPHVRTQSADLLVLLDRDPGCLATLNLGLSAPAPQLLLPTPTCLGTVSTAAVFGRVLGTVL